MISAEPPSTSDERHRAVMGWDTDPHACRTCGQSVDPESASRDLRMAILTGDLPRADATKLRLHAVGIDPAPIEAKALEEAADG